MPRQALVLAVICGEISFHLAHKTLKQLDSNALQLLVISDARSVVAWFPRLGKIPLRSDK